MKNIFKKIKDLIKTRRLLACFLLFFILSNIFQISTKAAGELDLNTTVSQDFLSGSLETLSKIGGAVVMFPIATVAFFISNFASSLIELEAKLLSWVVDISQFTKLEVVQMGWKICRDFANLFFIAILIYIAFAIILRLQKIDAKKMLFKVITMAIIINFSLMIGGIIIDFSQILFKYFIFSNLSLKTGVGFTNGLAHALNLQSLWATDDILINASATAEKVLTMGFFNVAIKLLFILLFSFIIIIVFGAMVLMLLVRNFWLWILLILSPLAWFLGIVPVPILSKYSGEWWKNFIKWTFMAPIMGFFVFLALSIVFFNKEGNGNTYTANQLYPKELLARQWEGDNSVFNFENNKSIFDPTNVMQLLVVLGFLIGGLMAGQSLGSGAAAGALGMVNKAKKGTQKWMGRKVANNPLTRGVTSLGARGLNQLSTVPIIGRAFKGLTADASKKRDDLRKEKGKLSKDLTSDQLKGMWKNLNDQEKAEGAKKIGFDKLSEQQFEAMQKIYSKQGYEKELKDLQKAQPHLTSKFKENAEKMIEKKQEFSKSDEPYRAAEQEEAKAKEKIDSNKIAYQKANENVEGLRKAAADTTEAEATREAARLSLAASTTDFQKAKDKKDALKIKRDEAKKEYEQSRVPLMESLEGVDLSKSSTISAMLTDKNSIQAQALYDVIKEQSSDKIMRLISSLESKDVSGKRNFNETIKLKKDVGINLTERLFLDAGGGNEGIEAVLKMRTIDSSPAARAGGYNFNSLIDGADRKIIDESTGRLIKEMARKQLKGDKLMKELAENIKRDSGQSSSGKKTGGESSESEEEKKS
jgi:hypothetical protein